ncbi:hypothetical protein ACFXKW_26365 [Streptomyces sp. NPDC059193]|uniref:hypothetical protein n=1 Tax=Streptomyces sp. NPDC059193 TaxID=3346763 RepID=UPI0036CA709E
MGDVRSSEFRRWLLRRCEDAGYDTEERELGATLVLLTALALERGLTPKETTAAAGTLRVTPQEVTDAYVNEMRQTGVEEILHHPGLAAITHHQ